MRLTAIDGVTFSYNDLGDVLTRVEMGMTNRYYSNTAIRRRPIAAERNLNTGEWQRYYVWSPNGTLLYYVDAQTLEPVYYHFDHVGNTILRTSDTPRTITFASRPARLYELQFTPDLINILWTRLTSDVQGEVNEQHLWTVLALPAFIEYGRKCLSRFFEAQKKIYPDASCPYYSFQALE